MKTDVYQRIVTVILLSLLEQILYRLGLKGPGVLSGYCDCPSISIDYDTLPTAQALGRHSRPQNSRNMILTGHNRTVAERTSHVGHDPGGQGEEWRPGRRCDPCHQNITLTHLVELSGIVNDPRQAGDTARTGGDSF